MSGTTGAFGWPFPTGSDRVMDGDNAIEALAEAIENSLSMLRPTQRGSSADLQLGTVDALVPSTGGAAITPLVGELWVVIIAAFFHATVMGFGDCTATLYVNGVANASMQYSPPAVPDRLTVTTAAVFVASQGVPTSYELRGRCTVAGGTAKIRQGTTLTLLRFPLVTTGALRDQLEAGDTIEALPAPGAELEEVER
jgi:hypothetical protein